MSEVLANEVWSCNADLNASAIQMFCSRNLSVPALASTWSAAFGIPLMSRSLMYLSDRSCSNEGHVKCQSRANQ